MQRPRGARNQARHSGGRVSSDSGDGCRFYPHLQIRWHRPSKMSKLPRFHVGSPGLGRPDPRHTGSLVPKSRWEEFGTSQRVWPKFPQSISGSWERSGGEYKAGVLTGGAVFLLTGAVSRWNCSDSSWPAFHPPPAVRWLSQ